MDDVDARCFHIVEKGRADRTLKFIHQSIKFVLYTRTRLYVSSLVTSRYHGNTLPHQSECRRSSHVYVYVVRPAAEALVNPVALADMYHPLKGRWYIVTTCFGPSWSPGPLMTGPA